MYRIAICDDEMMICSMIERVILNYQKICSHNLEIDVFTSGEELCREIEQNNVFYDVIYLDIELVNISGIEVSHVIRVKKENDLTKIIFISSKDNYYIDMFEVQPVAFLHKPLKEIDIIEKLKTAFRLLRKTAQLFEYIKDRHFCKQNIDEILYFESNNRKIIMVTVNERIPFNSKLEDIHEELKQYNFFYCHKSFLVNNAHVKEVAGKEIIMSNADVLPIGRMKQDEVMSALFAFGKGDRRWD